MRNWLRSQNPWHKPCEEGPSDDGCRRLFGATWAKRPESMHISDSSAIEGSVLDAFPIESLMEDEAV
jgi:hypothetical protein